MPWFRVDDGFHDHPKVVRAGNAAVGLWIRCASWSARHLTDGRIPATIVARFGRASQAAACERAGLWVLVDGDYCIPDWQEYNLSSVEVKRRRAADAERKRRQRAGDSSNVTLGLRVESRQSPRTPSRPL